MIAFPQAANPHGGFVVYDSGMNNWLKQINWYEQRLTEEVDLRIKLMNELADNKDRLQELENLLFVLTRHPNELTQVRKRLYRNTTVDNSKSETVRGV